jgi:ADP-heptose:LPS heptosyltransferase
VKNILIWHRGALGDLLLSGPALEGLAAHYPEARFSLCGSPAGLALLRQNLRVANIWDSQASQWTPLFMASSPLPSSLKSALGDIDLAVLCTPHPQPDLAGSLQEVGIKSILWIPSFPQHHLLPLAKFQALHLSGWGIEVKQQPFRLNFGAEEESAARQWFLSLRQEKSGPVIALAPGSGHRLKNWPLACYQELAPRLEKELGARLLWILGPAEEGWKQQLKVNGRQGERQFLDYLSLRLLASRLQLCQLHIGNDSGITHLAAATGGPTVVAIFGPSEARIWAPPGPQVTILSSALDCAPCTRGREISCTSPLCLQELTVEQVMSAALRVFK